MKKVFVKYYANSGKKFQRTEENHRYPCQQDEGRPIRRYTLTTVTMGTGKGQSRRTEGEGGSMTLAYYLDLWLIVGHNTQRYKSNMIWGHTWG